MFYLLQFMRSPWKQIPVSLNSRGVIFNLSALSRKLAKEMISTSSPRPKLIFLGETAQLSIRSQNSVGENDLSGELLKAEKISGPKTFSHHIWYSTASLAVLLALIYDS